MVQIANNGIITVDQGDSFTLPFYIYLGPLNNEIYHMAEGDRLYFAVMEPNASFDEAIIKKVYDWHDFDSQGQCVHIHFTTDDTANLLGGTYYYSVKLVRNHTIDIQNGIQTSSEILVDTVQKKTKFIIIQ